MAEAHVSVALVHCAIAMPASAASFEMLLALNQPGNLLMGWILMLAAMMLPLLIAPLRHVHISSFAQGSGGKPEDGNGDGEAAR